MLFPGKCPDPSLNLPDNPQLLRNEVPFGNPTVYNDTAGEIVNPGKNRNEVDDEWKQGQDLYKMSHNSYPVGEMPDRNYDWSVFPRDYKYGVETPHDVRGTGVSRAMKWSHETEEEQATHIVQKRLDDFRERTQPQIGKVSIVLYLLSENLGNYVDRMTRYMIPSATPSLWATNTCSACLSNPTSSEQET